MNNILASKVLDKIGSLADTTIKAKKVKRDYVWQLLAEIDRKKVFTGGNNISQEHAAYVRSSIEDILKIISEMKSYVKYNIKSIKSINDINENCKIILNFLEIFISVSDNKNNKVLQSKFEDFRNNVKKDYEFLA